MYTHTAAHPGHDAPLHELYVYLCRQQDGRCFYCQQLMLLPIPTAPKPKNPLPPDRITREHLLPRAHGGTEHPHNIVGACARCNHQRGSDIPWIEFLALKVQQAWAVQQ